MQINQDTQNQTTVSKNKFAKFVYGVVAILMLIGLGYGATFVYFKSQTPDSIAYPIADHYHFRMQLIINGKEENFGSDAYQIDYKKGICGAELTTEPIHFHDKRNQMVHIHWSGITGGLVLKNYGLNKIGGPEDKLGWRLDNFWQLVPQPKAVPIHGKVIPRIDSGQNFWVYTGDESSYQQKNWQDFLNQDLEDFFGKTSEIRRRRQEVEKLEKQQGFLNLPVEAHTTEDSSGSSSSFGTSAKTQAELQKINNLLGNVVIFAQKDQPNDEQIKDRFNNLVPLEDSTCGG